MLHTVVLISFIFLCRSVLHVEQNAHSKKIEVFIMMVLTVTGSALLLDEINILAPNIIPVINIIHFRQRLNQKRSEIVGTSGAMKQAHPIFGIGSA